MIITLTWMAAMGSFVCVCVYVCVHVRVCVRGIEDKGSRTDHHAHLYKETNRKLVGSRRQGEVVFHVFAAFALFLPHVYLFLSLFFFLTLAVVSRTSPSHHPHRCRTFRWAE